MAQILQYPHYLFVCESDNSTQNEDGTWSTDVTNTVRLHSRCREETDGRGSEIDIGGGTYRKYTSLIQLPKSAKRIEEGTEVFVANDTAGTDVRIRGTVLKFDAGQLHARLWL